MTSRKVNLIAGPSKWDLMMSLFERQEVMFTMEGGIEFKLVIDALMSDRFNDPFDAEENYFSDDDEMLFGHEVWLAYGTFYPEEIPARHVADALISAYIFYSTQVRKGVVRLIHDADGGEKGFFREEWAYRITKGE